MPSDLRVIKQHPDQDDEEDDVAVLQTERLTLDDLRASVDEVVRAKLGVSVDEFLAKYEAQELDLSSPAMSRMAVLARLILAARQR